MEFVASYTSYLKLAAMPKFQGFLILIDEGDKFIAFNKGALTCSRMFNRFVCKDAWNVQDKKELVFFTCIPKYDVPVILAKARNYQIPLILFTPL